MLRSRHATHRAAVGRDPTGEQGCSPAASRRLSDAAHRCARRSWPANSPARQAHRSGATEGTRSAVSGCVQGLRTLICSASDGRDVSQTTCHRSGTRLSKFGQLDEGPGVGARDPGEAMRPSPNQTRRRVAVPLSRVSARIEKARKSGALGAAGHKWLRAPIIRRASAYCTRRQPEHRPCGSPTGCPTVQFRP